MLATRINRQPQVRTDFSDIYSMSLNGGDCSDNINGTNSSLNALRLNTLLSNSLDLRQPSLESRHSIDSLWSDGNKARNSLEGEMTLGRLLAQTYSYSSDSSISPRTSKSRYSPPQVSRTNGVFSYGDDSPHSNGSSSSRQSFNYSSIGSSGSYPARGLRMSSVSDPGSPTLDDAILMGCVPDSPFLNNSSNSCNTTLQSQENSLIELMNSLAVNNNINHVGNGLLNGNMSNNRQYQNNSNSQIHCPNSLSQLSATSNSLLANSLGLNNCINIGGNQHGNSSSLLSQGSPSSLAQLSATSNSLLANSLGLNSNLNIGSSHSGNSSSMLSQGISDLSLAQLQGMWLNSQLCSNLSLSSSDPYAIEKAAKMHRNAAALCDATCTWSGQLPVRVTKNPFYSCKVFLGGVPWDVTEMTLRQAFIQFGNIQVEWPGKENSANPPRGYVYILFENEKQVKALLAACTDSSDNYYFKISSRRMRQKEVQVIPWIISDSNYVRCPSYQLDPAKTVFVGALHGMLSAEALANIMNDLFGGVVYSGIDTDKHKYPIGSGRVTFNNVPAYRKAVRAAFIEIKTPKFTKKVQVDPYLADSLCQSCCLQPGPYFCRDENCFKYYCRTCWHLQHSGNGEVSSHKPLMRDPKLRTQTSLSRVI